MSHNIVAFTGAGISADSGLATFRDSEGWWQKYDIRELASPQAFREDPQKVLAFYNERRQNVAEARPNEAHKAIAELEEQFDVTVITQNVDDLHERAGSTHVLHLHGLITKARSERDTDRIIDIGYEDIEYGDTAEDGGQLRPHVVWFGESVMNIQEAVSYIRDADIFIVVGTSLQVYPAAGLVDETAPDAEKYLVDPSELPLADPDSWHHFKENARTGVTKLKKQLVENHNKN
jgi:NAD-dependent deacetylase